MCETKFLRMCSFSIILPSLHSFDLSCLLLCYSFLLLYLSFHLDSLLCYNDALQFWDFHPGSRHTHTDSPYFHPITHIPSFPNTPLLLLHSPQHQTIIYIIYEVISDSTKIIYLIVPRVKNI